MHQIEPFYYWLKYYDPGKDLRSMYYGKEYNYDLYTETIYGYYIDPGWDPIGSETLYTKLLYAGYQEGYAVIEFIGEWNDTLNNDIMHLKRGLIDHLLRFKVDKFILIGENVFNFHGSDDCYYEEWFDDVEDGWVASVNFADHVQEEQRHYGIDNYINMGGNLQIGNWRTMSPKQFCSLVNQLITRRLIPGNF